MTDKHLRRSINRPTINYNRTLTRSNTIVYHNPDNVIFSNALVQPKQVVQQTVKQETQRAVVQPKKYVVTTKRNQLIEPKKAAKKPVEITRISQELTADQKRTIVRLKGTGAGRSFLILGNGPSLNDIDTGNLSRNSKLDICCINVPDGRCWPTKYWAFYDISQYGMHRDLYNSYNGTLFNSTTIKGQNENAIKFKHLSGLGYSRDASAGIYIGMSSVYATIQIAMYMNYDNIFIAGCDMNEDVDKSKTHFYGVNKHVKPDTRVKRFQKEANWYNRMVDELTPEERNKLTFCSKGINKWSFISHFNSIEPQHAEELINEKTS